MLRTNQNFLDYIQKLYDKQNHKDNIILNSYKKGENLFLQGQKAIKIMIIKSGISKCYFFEENNKEYILEFLGKGEIIGEIEAVKKVECLCSVQAVMDVQVFQLSAPYFNELLNTDIYFNRLLIETFSDRIINTSSRASYQQLFNSEKSLTKLLALLSQQKMKVSKEDMSAYLGISLRSLNRLLKKLN
ncbi:Crp/Fnr family transcriptional regulator [uncultured Tenacibaculum sp.]|uniref:Crp/Fnr family transcriptional regulator n=1 Tax=uncultured Tenacibaculum sp. TaxID=174713 RepID=UPI002620075C|nr:Crp/Fnr family transcriptional regulator [uncultured Tenacibaculum sp.]